MTASWVTCAVLLPVIAAIAFAGGWSVRRSRSFLSEVNSWQAGWDTGCDAARRLYERGRAVTPEAFTVTVQRDEVQIRCIHCGKWAVPVLGPGFTRGDCIALADLTGWAQDHECPPVTVT